MYNWHCTSCGYETESERCPMCKYSNCRACHIMEYAIAPPKICPRCETQGRFIDLDDPEHQEKMSVNS